MKNSIINLPIPITHVQSLGIHDQSCVMHTLSPSPTNPDIMASINMSVYNSKRQE